MSGPPPPVDGAGREDDAAWRRLSTRVIWVDGARAVVAVVPLVVSSVVFRADPAPGLRFVLIGIAVSGVVSAVGNTARWLRSRYRVTAEHVELISGWAVRNHRSVRRERIRSVDVSAKLHHRLGGLRVVSIRAAGDGSGGEATFALDALSVDDARELRRLVTAASGPSVPSGAWVSSEVGVPVEGEPEGSTPEGSAPVDEAPGVDGPVLARFRWGWVPWNAVSVWGLVLAPLFLFGVVEAVAFVGADADRWLSGTVRRIADRSVVAAVVVTVGAAAVVGVVGLAASFVGEWWDHRLFRHDTPDRSVLRSTQGLLSTREIDRDLARVRGVTLREPLGWRWADLVETDLVSTGLTATTLAGNGAATILPRCPMREARPVVAAVLQTTEPLDVEVAAHPPAARRRRVVRAAAGSASLFAAAAALGAVWDGAPAWRWLVAAASVPVGLAVALVAHRNLGHAAPPDHLVTRAGVLARSTTVLERRAAIGCVVRQSVLQRRRGLATLTVTTAAGYGRYDVIDAAAADVAPLVSHALPEATAPFVRAGGDQPASTTTVADADRPNTSGV